MTTVAVLVVVFTAAALGLSAAALLFSLSARGTARQASEGVRQLAARRRPAEERQANLGAPRDTGERRQRDLGIAARHRAPDDERARRRDHDDPQWRTDPAPPEGELPTTEHPAPTTTYRRPPPPLPRPGAIGRPT